MSASFFVLCWPMFRLSCGLHSQWWRSDQKWWPRWLRAEVHWSAQEDPVPARAATANFRGSEGFRAVHWTAGPCATSGSADVSGDFLGFFLRALAWHEDGSQQSWDTWQSRICFKLELVWMNCWRNCGPGIAIAPRHVVSQLVPGVAVSKKPKGNIKFDEFER